MTLQLDPLVDVPGTLMKQQNADSASAQVGVLQAQQALDQTKYNREVGKEDQLQGMMPQLLQKYRAGDQSAFMQIAQLNPKMGEMLLNMDTTNSEISLRNVEIRKAQMAMVQQAKAQKLQAYTQELQAVQGLQSALSGVQSPEEKNKILKLYRKSVERTGIKIPPLLQGDYSPEMETDLTNMATLGAQMIKAMQAPAEPYTLNPGDKRFGPNNQLVASNDKPAEPIKVGQNETLVDPNTMKPVFTNGEKPADEAAATKQAAADQLANVDKAINYMGGGDVSGNPSADLGKSPTLDQRVNAAAAKGVGAGGLSQMTKVIESTDAGTLQSMIDTINSNTAIDTLKQMKAQSKTGSSGMGALSEKELDLLLNKISSLKVGMKPELLARNLLEVRQRYQRISEELDVSKSAEVQDARAQGAVPAKVLKFDAQGNQVVSQ